MVTLKANQRLLTDAELADLMARRQERQAAGESVTDLERFEPIVEVDMVDGSEWLVYRKREGA